MPEFCLVGQVHGLGGKPIRKEYVVAIAWSWIIPIWGMLLWIPQLLLFGKEMFMEEMPSVQDNYPLLLALISTASASLFIHIWGYIALLQALREVQGFSFMKALGNVIIASAVFAGILIVTALAMLVVYINFGPGPNPS